MNNTSAGIKYRLTREQSDKFERYRQSKNTTYSKLVKPYFVDYVEGRLRLDQLPHLKTMQLPHLLSKDVRMTKHFKNKLMEKVREDETSAAAVARSIVEYILMKDA
jgi:hypothetical protein